jgi:hypothetical protein
VEIIVLSFLPESGNPGDPLLQALSCPRTRKF